ncbi:MAG: hypothetical protein Q4A84_05370 [Neisseria sp.]|uniref:hypothetical protein n=1 Tax=Neisseria sp. TaxID=192066 RepID=UPI0026DD8F62|nr:hypothetical protein [Neisseria sp.]MDO4641117.1 hypothetical protein [Neisseria sp.]
MNMRNLSVLGCMAMLSACAGSTAATVNTESSVIQLQETEADRVLIIFYDAEIGKEPILAAAKAYDASIVYQYHMLQGVSVSIPKNKTMQDAVEFFKSVKGVLSVNRNKILQLLD